MSRWRAGLHEREGLLLYTMQTTLKSTFCEPV